jgi:hypothetical protein
MVQGDTVGEEADGSDAIEGRVQEARGHREDSEQKKEPEADLLETNSRGHGS